MATPVYWGRGIMTWQEMEQTERDLILTGHCPHCLSGPNQQHALICRDHPFPKLRRALVEEAQRLALPAVERLFGWLKRHRSIWPALQ